MNLDNVRLAIGMLRELAREDVEAALCLMDWARVAMARANEREKAAKEHRKPVLAKIEMHQPTLEEMGIHVVGCSACAVTPKNRVCPGCGNKGVAPIRQKRKTGRR